MQRSGSVGASLSCPGSCHRLYPNRETGRPQIAEPQQSLQLQPIPAANGFSEPAHAQDGTATDVTAMLISNSRSHAGLFVSGLYFIQKLFFFKNFTSHRIYHIYI